MTNLGEVAHPVSVVDGPRRGDGIGDLAQLGLKRLGSGQAEEIMDAVRLAEVHGLGACIMTVAADGDPGCRPLRPDTAVKAADMGAHPRRRTASCQASAPIGLDCAILAVCALHDEVAKGHAETKGRCRCLPQRRCR